MVENGELIVPYVATDDNLADFFTKPLTARRFFTLRNKIMNVSLTENEISSKDGSGE